MKPAFKHENLSKSEVLSEVMGRILKERPFDGFAQTTVVLYEQKIETIFKQFGGKRDPKNLYAHLKNRLDTGVVTRATFNTERAAIKYYLLSEMHKQHLHGEPLAANFDSYLAISSLVNSGLPMRSLKTSSPKAKFFAHADMDKVINACIQNPRSSKYNSDLVAFLKANRHVGLRPSEWFFSELTIREDKTFVLRVKNAKHTHGRGNGEHRDLILNQISREDAASIYHFIALLQPIKDQITHSGDDFNYEHIRRFYYNIQRAFSKNIKANLPDLAKNPPTIYSVRHQLVADAKAGGLSPVEISAFFGHNSIETAKQHYGTKHKGSRKPFKFMPSDESIQAVANKGKVGISLSPSEMALKRIDDMLDPKN